MICNLIVMYIHYPIHSYHACMQYYMHVTSYHSAILRHALEQSLIIYYSIT